ncbi:transposon protein [Artemisia annua]|uniref:Transposon protein n=1 Tax=Artemisia annua TaxID=35608 RepID=A0A2U1M0E9_ARTAN|nr:transposon protein [Artemisia annua]
MLMERQWMYGMSLNDPEFVKGVDSFLIAAESNRVAKGDIEIFCPCSKCKNLKPFTDIKTIEWHLHRYGFVRKYTCWSEHGESLVGNSTSSHLWDDTRHLKPMEIDQVALTTLNAFHMFVVDSLDATAPQ